MRTGYQTSLFGTGKWGKFHDDLDEMMTHFHGYLARYVPNGPYHWRKKGSDNWSGPQTEPELTAVVRKRMTEGVAGAKLITRGDHLDGPKIAVRKVVRSSGPNVMRVALDQLGVDYNWADDDPRGSASPGFDCSGLTKYCYDAGAGVELPHSADAQLNDPQVHSFGDRSKLKKGDLIFYHVGRLGPGQADHVGIAVGEGLVVDASSSADEVVLRDMDANPIMVFGFVPDVTGQH